MGWSNPIWLVILAALLSGLIGVVISTCHYRRFERRKLKLDTSRRLLAYRHAGVPGSSLTTQGHFFAALNEVFVVFHDTLDVVRVLQMLHVELRRPERLQDNLVSLFKAICGNLHISLEAVNDSFFLHPFVPGVSIIAKKDGV